MDHMAREPERAGHVIVVRMWTMSRSSVRRADPLGRTSGASYDDELDAAFNEVTDKFTKISHRTCAASRPARRSSSANR